MKLIKIITTHTQEEIDEILVNMSKYHIKILSNLYSTFNYVEFINEYNFVSMFCVVDDNIIDKLKDNYNSLSISFKFEDITKDVLLCNKIRTNFLEYGIDVSDSINDLINSFYLDNITIDDILDKISAKGIKSINDVDKILLERVI
jgi:hypothetical protein